ncbi:ABC transporter permease [Olsenella sp. kh2p3]|uniref:ABC transporter permease n=1 Tax=Olsenella sp. kh2p3 TaxID=1797112 RepID=UPI0009143294|nr:ABC transporter permease [Olsenella sp. kh2p3]SFX38423.1 ABC-2 type transport system permease protein [Olsenella sp. kh2p3]
MTTFRTYLKIFLSHRVYIAIYLVMLSLVGVTIGLSTSSAATGEFQPTSVNVAVIDRDGSELSAALASHVLAGNNQVDVADEKRAIQDAVARDQVSYLLVIPAGWGEGLLDAARQGTEAPNLETYVSYYSGAGRLVDVEATGYADGLYGMAATLGGSGADVIAATDASWEGSTRVSMIEQAAAPLPASIVAAAEFASYPIFSSAMVCIAVLMSSVGRQPVRDRRLASPEPAHARNLALLGACVTIALIAWAWNFGLEVAVLGGSALASSPVQVALVGAALLVYALVSASVGFLAGQLGVSENAANALANILGMVMSFLGGAWTGLSLLPDELLAVAHFTPAYWVTLVVEGAAGMGEVSTATVLPLVGNLGICALFGVAAVLVGLALGRSRSRAQVA